MRIISVDNAKENMILGKPVYGLNGEILLNEEVVLNIEYLKRLKEKNIPCIYIKDEISKDIEVDNVIDLDVNLKAISVIKNVMYELRSSSTSVKKNMLSYENYTKIRGIVDDILESIKKNSKSLFNLVQIMSTDLYTYTHSVNVSVMAMMIALELDIPDNIIKEIGVGGIMHDIGKSRISADILNKPTSLTKVEYEVIKTHTTIGYQILKDDPNISSYVKVITLMHHEKLDGSGYPNGIEGDAIHQCVRIVTACDILDALITDRVYKEKYPMYKALEILAADVPQKLDKNIYDILRRKVNPYPEGSAVLLSDGTKGIVIRRNIGMPIRPVVRIIRDSNGQLRGNFKLVDLMKNLTLFIEDLTDLGI